MYRIPYTLYRIMPRVTQYIRNDDMPAWEAIENKSEWIHEHLHENDLKTGMCKIHGIPLTLQGKCLQKGCKYA